MSWNAHLFVSVVSITSFAVIISLVRRRRMSGKYAFLWVSVGMVMIALSISPALLDWISLMVGINYGPATLFLFATAFLLLVSVQFSWELSRLEERTRRLAEEHAILQAERASDPARE